MILIKMDKGKEKKILSLLKEKENKRIIKKKNK